MTSITTLRRTKAQLLAGLRQLRLDIASGRRPTMKQTLDRIVIEANANAEIQ